MLAYRMLVAAVLLAVGPPAAAAQNEVPAALRDLKPHQIIEAVLAERQALDLSGLQERKLDSMHLAIRSEPHRYQSTGSPSKAHRSTRMLPMISDETAFEEAMGVLTPEQRTRALAKFNDPGYRLPPGLRRERPASADSSTDPLQHRRGEAPPAAAQGEGGKPADPVTHRP